MFVRSLFLTIVMAWIAIDRWLPVYTNDAVGLGLILMGTLGVFFVVNKRFEKRFEKIGWLSSWINLTSASKSQPLFYALWGVGLTLIGVGFLMHILMAIYMGCVFILTFGIEFLRCYPKNKQTVDDRIIK